MNAHRSRWPKRILLLFGSLLAAALVVAAGAYCLFYGPQPATLPCRSCDGEAQKVHVNGFERNQSASGRC